MKKPFKVLTTSAMVAALAATSLIPVAAAQAEETLTISDVVFVSVEGPLAKVDMSTYNFALGEKVVNPKDVTHILLSSGEAYPMSAYNFALGESEGNNQKAIELLKANVDPITDEVLPGEIQEDGTVTVGEQPEDRLNETFFYNVA